MHVVSNTSPLSNLAIIGHLDLLQHRYGLGEIPMLRAELLRLRSEADFFIDAGIERFMLSQAGE
jgi:predicted nucleic acid-binding protein